MTVATLNNGQLQMHFTFTLLFIMVVYRLSREEELEKKRAEMLDNAKWRADQRSSNVKKYQEEDEKEKLIVDKTQQAGSQAFLK